MSDSIPTAPPNLAKAKAQDLALLEEDARRFPLRFQACWNLTGERFGRLVVLDYVGRSRWRCACDCGALKTITAQYLRRGSSRSCGCLGRENAVVSGARLAAMHQRHGHAGKGRQSRTYTTWIAMWQRCVNSNLKCYPNYGGRGIAVCERWRVFDDFLADMGERLPGTSIDRVDVNGNYEPGNCRWATPTEQRKNRRDRAANSAA